MEISTVFLITGVLMTLLGLLMIFVSLRAHPSEIDGKQKGIVYIGNIPFVVGGPRRWIVTALGVVILIMFYLTTRRM